MQSTLAVISLKRIKENARLVGEYAGAPLIAVVKDDAYGHGAERVALALEEEASSFAVATVAEGAALRTAGVGKEILVLTPALSEEEGLSAFAHGLTPTVGSEASLRLLLRAGEKWGFPVSAQLALNTGMNRYGVRPSLTGRICRAAREAGAQFTGVFSHFYDPASEGAREAQYAAFCRASNEVKEYFPAAKRHLSATGGILAGKKYNFDAVRSGIALYGYLPAGFGGRLPVRPAMKVYAQVAGGGVPFGGGWGYGEARGDEKSFFTLRAGYGDGLFRTEEEGCRCMDATVLEGRAEFGKRRRLPDPATYARLHGTSVYEILIALARKAVREYRD